MSSVSVFVCLCHQMYLKMRVESCNDGPQEPRQTEMDPGKPGNPHPCRTRREGLDGATKPRGASPR